MRRTARQGTAVLLLRLCLRLLETRGHVVGGLPDRRQLRGILVGDAHSGAILELLDERDEVQRVGLEVLLEASVVLDARWIYLQLLREVAADELEDLVSIHQPGPS
jgi:hypothetical protein